MIAIDRGKPQTWVRSLVNIQQSLHASTESNGRYLFSRENRPPVLLDPGRYVFIGNGVVVSLQCKDKKKFYFESYFLLFPLLRVMPLEVKKKDNIK